jgi:hypothetical protein
MDVGKANEVKSRHAGSQKVTSRHAGSQRVKTCRQKQSGSRTSGQTNRKAKACKLAEGGWYVKVGR